MPHLFQTWRPQTSPHLDLEGELLLFIFHQCYGPSTASLDKLEIHLSYYSVWAKAHLVIYTKWMAGAESRKEGNAKLTVIDLKNQVSATFHCNCSFRQFLCLYYESKRKKNLWWTWNWKEWHTGAPVIIYLQTRQLLSLQSLYCPGFHCLAGAQGTVFLTFYLSRIGLPF